MTKEAYLSSLVPRMYKSEFDDKAAEILAQHCPEALEKPMPVPIEEIARDKLHLLIKEYHLSEDLSILGQMCFTDGLVEIYDPSGDEYREVFVKAKTMIIDPDTYLKRNFGSRRNTVAHECVHWIYHRNYFLAMRHLRPARHSVRIDSCVYKRIQTAMPEIISVTITIEFKDIAHVVAWTYSGIRISAVLLL